jgi:hypothetical protein
MARRSTSRCLGLLVGVALLSAACSSGTGHGARSSTTTTRPPIPAGRLPSAISKEVCSQDAQGEIAQTLGETAQIQTPTWSDHVYACHLLYSGNAFVALSVKELSSWPQTYAYFGMLKTQLGNTGSINGLGQGAFQAPNGDVVVRKDWKVLTVNIQGLPPQFGKPPTPANDVAVTVADVILGCWAGD